MSQKQDEHVLYETRTVMLTAFFILMLSPFFGPAFAQVESPGVAEDTPAAWTVLIGWEAAIEPQE